MQSTRQGTYTTLEAEPGRLIIRLTDEGRAELADNLPNTDEALIQVKNGYHIELNWTKPHADILQEMLEDHLANGWTMPDAAQIGALTSSPLLAYGCDYDEEGFITKSEALYWFPDYQVKSELDQLLREGFVTFVEANEDTDEYKEKYTCTECLAEFDNASAAVTHQC